jgi:CheY-like chemotaxis protein
MGALLIIWVIDDDTNEHFFVEHAFAKSSVGNVVRCFDSAKSAMHALQSAAPQELPHVVLCDLKMPCVDGFEFLHWLRHSEWKSMPIALFSNSNVQADIDRGYAMGANAFHVKSSTPDQLCECVDVIARFWGGVARLPNLGTGRPQLAH